MMRRITIRDLARAQIVEAFNRYNLSPTQRGQAFLDKVDERIEDLAQFPLSCAIAFRDVRKARLSGFAYVLLYAVREEQGEPYIVVLACVHERSDPQTWRKMSG